MLVVCNVIARLVLHDTYISIVRSSACDIAKHSIVDVGLLLLNLAYLRRDSGQVAGFLTRGLGNIRHDFEFVQTDSTSYEQLK